MSDINLTPQQKGCLGCFGVVAIPCIAILLYAAFMDQRNNATIARGMKSEPAISILPSELMMDATGALYDGKVVQVRGMVVEKSADKFGCIVLLGAGVGKEGIYCTFGPEWWPNISKWSKGDRMNVRGVVSSGFGAPSMSRCQIDQVR